MLDAPLVPRAAWPSAQPPLRDSLGHHPSAARTLPGDGSLRHQPGGVEQYLRELGPIPARAAGMGPAAVTGAVDGAAGGGAERRSARREATRLEREVERLIREEAGLEGQIAAAATDYERVLELDARRRELADRRDRAEHR